MKTKNIEDTTDDAYLKAVGDRVRDARKALGLSQEKLAELADIHTTYVSHIETGTNASIGVYRKVATALRVPLVQLLDVNQKRIAPDAISKAMAEIRALPVKEQRMIISAVKGLLAGMKGKEK